MALKLSHIKEYNLKALLPSVFSSFRQFPDYPPFLNCFYTLIKGIRCAHIEIDVAVEARAPYEFFFFDG